MLKKLGGYRRNAWVDIAGICRRVAVVVEEHHQLFCQRLFQVVIIEPVGMDGSAVNQFLNLAREVNAFFIGILKAVLVAQLHENVVKSLFLKRYAEVFELRLIYIQLIEYIHKFAGQRIDFLIDRALYLVDGIRGGLVCKGEVVAGVILVDSSLGKFLVPF